MKTYLILTVGFVALLGALSILVAPGVAAEPLIADGELLSATISLDGPVDPAALYKGLCAACHGNKGEGGFGPALTDLTERADPRLAEVITQGKGKMPASGAKLSAAEVEALIGFMRSGFTVSPPAQAKEAEAAPTTVPVAPASLQVDLSQEARGGVGVRIALRSRERVPIAGASVTLHRLTAMSGNLLVAELTTDANGEASYRLDAVKGQAVKLEAAYAGGSKWGPARVQAGIEMGGTAQAPSPISAATSAAAPPALAALFAIVIGAVWLTYGYVAYRLLQIWRGAT